MAMNLLEMEVSEKVEICLAKQSILEKEIDYSLTEHFGTESCIRNSKNARIWDQIVWNHLHEQDGLLEVGGGEIDVLVVALAIISVTCFRFQVSTSGERKDVLLSGSLEARGVIYQCGIVFPGISAILHGVFISYSVGGIIGPLIAEPFLAYQDRTPLATNQTTNNSSSSQDCKSFRDLLSIKNIQSNANSEMQDLYITLGSLHLPAFLGFITLFLLERRDTMQYQRNASTNGDYTIMEEGPEPISRPSAILFYVCLVFANISYSGLQYAYGGYLSVYGVTSHLHLSAQRMANMTSAYWMFFTLGRILGTILSLYMRQTVLIYTCLISVLMASASVIVLTPFGEVWLWIGTMIIGLFSGPLLAGGLVWCGSWLTLTPVVVGLCTFGDLTGTFLLQYCTGQLMGHFGEDWYLKFMLILSVIELMTFAVLTVIRYYIQKSRVCRK